MRAEEKKTAPAAKTEAAKSDSAKSDAPKKDDKADEAHKLFVEGVRLVADADQALQEKKDGECQRMTKLAIESFEKALKITPEDGEIMLALGAQYFNQGQIDKATETYKQAIAALKKDNLRDLLGLAVLNLAGAYYAQEKYELALKEVNSALGFDPDSDEAKKLKAACEEHLKEKEKKK
ncbi:MAG: tetratricopeptide repeat protein [Planctomycetes bacterium]|nr:tetratricopeptide repeat protein [Planctomycetota bacterium]